MPQSNVKSLELSSFDTDNLETTYNAVNSSGFSHAIFKLRIINNSNRDITISYNGVDDHDFLPEGESLNLAVQTNAQPNSSEALFSARTKVFIKGEVSGTGNIYVTGYYV